MNAVYKSIGTTRQNVHKRLNKAIKDNEERALLLPLMRQVREDHPGMGALVMYTKLRPQTMGRDRFLCFYNEQRFRIQTTRNFRRTTNSCGVIRFDNHLAGRELTGVNQAWASDITYYEMQGKFFYLTFIMDLHSRKIKGYAASATLRTADTTIPALLMAMKYLREGDKPIFHSDGGGQYYSKEFLSLTQDKFINSMCESVYENSQAERVNGTIKNDYLRWYDPTDYKQLNQMLKRAVNNYNYERPHQSLKGNTPHYFEVVATEGNSQFSELPTKEKRNKKENFFNNLDKTMSTQK